MGGGDLNLKKSWHPSTMRNMEKVWKAEQKNDQEKRKIAELQREIMEERAREDMQKYAEDKGVVEKKDNTKLDWMYKGPGGMVNREEYLLGRSVDKAFEQQQQTEKNASSVTTTRNHVDYECLPPSIFAGGNEQVDMARKLQEDPLYAIKKKEMETRSQLLSNPVKLKQLRELIKVNKSQKVKKHKKEKKSKKSKKKRRRSSSSESESTDLDTLLLAKYNKLKDKLRKEDLTKLDNIPASSDTDSEEKGSKSKKHSNLNKRKHHSSESSSDGEHRAVKKQYGLVMMSSSSNDRSTKSLSHSTTSKEWEKGSKESDSGRHKSEHVARWKQPERKKLTEEEKEQKRREMMDNVQWRNQERVKNMSRYKKEEKEEKKQSKTYSTEFINKQLSYAASHGTVESRIKANINNIQRSGMAMDKNFARR